MFYDTILTEKNVEQMFDRQQKMKKISSIISQLQTEPSRDAMELYNRAENLTWNDTDEHLPLVTLKNIEILKTMDNESLDIIRSHGAVWEADFHHK